MEAHIDTEASKAVAPKTPAWVVTLGRAVVLCLALYGGYKFFIADDPAPAHTTAADANAVRAAQILDEKPPAVVPPTHRYSLHQDGEYGYEQGISEDDQKKGVVTKPLMMVRYLGNRNGEQTAEMVENGVHFVLSCQVPCTFVKSRVVVDGQTVNEITSKNTPGSVMSEIMLDAMSGQLDVYKAPSHSSDE